MTSKQLHLMKLLSTKKGERVSYVKWTFEGVTDEDVMELQDKGLVFVENGGFQQDLRMLYLTADGHEFIKEFCDVCECMPCDCDWGMI